MQKNQPDPTRPYAPLPSSVVRTRLRLGSWFQSHQALGRIISILAVAAGAIYLIWRVVYTLPGADPIFFWPLFLAEAFGYITFINLVVEAWAIPMTPRLAPIDTPVDILIATYNEDLDIVLPTVIGALKVRGNTTIWLCDDGKRAEMKALAKHYGINYQTRPNNLHAKAGNINAVLPKLKGELILVLDADHVPAPDFLEPISGYFADPKLALVQTAHSFRNHNSVMHEEEGRHEQSLFFDVLLPGRNRLKSVFWCGSAGLIRRSALVDVGGMAVSTCTEDFETSLSLQVAGYEIKYHNEHLVQGLAPDTLEAYTIQRFRWAQGTIGSYRRGGQKAWSRKLSLGQKFSYTGGLIYHLTPLQRIAYTFSIVAVALFAAKAVGYSGELYLLFWGTWVLLSLVAVEALERGSTQPFEGIRNHMLVLESFLRALPSIFTNKELKFTVTPKNTVDLGGWQSVKLLRVPIFLIAITLVALIVRWIDMWQVATIGHGFLGPITPAGIVVATVFGVTEFVILSITAYRIYARRQYRKIWRFPVDLPARLTGDKAKCIDLHHAGAGIVVPTTAAGLKDAVVGDTLTLSIDCRTASGAAVVANGRLTVSNIRPYSEAGTTTRLGGVVEWASPEERDYVVEHCYVVEPYVARNKVWARRAPRIPVSLSTHIFNQVAKCIDISLTGAAFLSAKRLGDVGDVVPVKLTLEDGRTVKGNLDVKNVSKGKDKVYRVGGVVQWEDTSWLLKYTTLAMAPSSNRNSPIPAV